jgi:excisionase family DNA binding protein
MHPPGPENGEARDLAGCSRLSAKQNSNDISKLRHPGVSIKEASAYFSVHEKTVSRWIKSGKLKVDRLPSGRARVILEALK